MRLRTDDPQQLHDLAEHLRRWGAVVSVSGGEELDAGLVGSYGSDDAMRMDLDLLVRAWEAGQAGRHVEILD